MRFWSLGTSRRDHQLRSMVILAEIQMFMVVERFEWRKIA